MMNKIKLSNAIANMDKTNLEKEYDVQIFQQELGLEQTYTNSDKISTRLTSGYLRKWICTDTWVGTRVFFLDGEPVAITTQSARKADEIIYFINDDSIAKMRDFCISLLEDEETTDERYNVVSFDTILDAFYTVSYGSQLLTDSGFYNNQSVKVIKTWNTYDVIDKWTDVKVRFENGEEQIIKMSEFIIPLGQ